jgi:large subunit ribosomal protein L4
MKVNFYGYDGQIRGEIEIPDEIFSAEVKEHLFYYVVNWQMAKRRTGTACTKTRGEVSGGGAKPWPQKHMGRARQGSIRAPHWRKGGVVFGPKPRDYEFDIPKKVRKEAVKSALSYRFKAGELTFVEDFKLPEIKTKRIVNFLKNFKVNSGLLLIPEKDEFIEISARNIPDFKVLRVEGLNVYDILKYSPLFVKISSIPLIQRRLS